MIINQTSFLSDQHDGLLTNEPSNLCFFVKKAYYYKFDIVRFVIFSIISYIEQQVENSKFKNYKYYRYMTVKYLALLLLLTTVYSQVVSITDFLTGKSKATPDKTPVGNVDVSQSGAFTPSSSFIPCGSKDSCGQAKSFQNQKEFQDFLSKNLKQPAEAIPAIKTIPVPKSQPIISAQPDIVAPSRQAQIVPSAMIDTPQSQIIRSAQSRSYQAASAPKYQAYIVAPPPERQASLYVVAPPINPANEFSGTNNQVDNVDEADLLKTDGTYIYTVSNQILSIILAYPSKRAKVMSKLNFEDFNASALFLEGDYLAIFGTKWKIGYYEPDYTFVKIYDVSNRALPDLLREFKVAGKYVDGRKLSSGYMYLVTNYEFTFSYRVVPWFDFGNGRRNLDYSSIFYYPTFDYSEPTAVNIFSFDLSNPNFSRRKVVTVFSAKTSAIYMSEQHIYLATNTTINGIPYTQLKKIFVQGLRIIPFADGIVRGSFKDQFSLDEYSPYLRIATTDLSVNSNNVFVLDYNLNNYGALTGIAFNERIYSCRYVDKRLYLVTFRTQDPFFVISFRNHKAPKILGELKISGVSTYLHPYDETTIIGIGRQTDDRAVRLGLKIELFDVSDVTRPRSSATFEISETYANSSAEWEHKAFLFSADKNLLVIPGHMQSTKINFNGAFAFYISKTEITLKSAIDHLLNPADDFELRNVQRSLWINDLLYTKSLCLLRINEINDTFDLVKSVNIPCDPSLLLLSRRSQSYPVPSRPQ